MILCIDIGGTAVKYALVDRMGAIHARHEYQLEGYDVPLVEAALQEAVRFAEKEKTAPRGVAVSATGQIDSREGIVIGTNGKIPNYEGSRISEACETRFGVPACALNDANAAALGEWFAGAGKEADPMLMITLGTGVGSGIIIGGRLFEGMRGIAGELGQFPLFCDRAKAENLRGTYEEYASTSALVRRMKAVTGEKTLDGRMIFDRAGTGDETALAVLNQWTDDIALGLIGFVHIFNPQRIVIGGGVSRQEKLLLQPLRAKVAEGVLPRFAEGLEIEPAVLGNDAGLIGAACFWQERFG